VLKSAEPLGGAFVRDSIAMTLKARAAGLLIGALRHDMLHRTRTWVDDKSHDCPTHPQFEDSAILAAGRTAARAMEMQTLRDSF
jgi:hypothetical protein